MILTSFRWGCSMMAEALIVFLVNLIRLIVIYVYFLVICIHCKIIFIM
ncbi:hypothetical protein HanXRQr2_Chr16g0744391 [Helianthus annuus]|uniref:Uncharacterized protein n=1 Tax=Helianthus annuus TaxID=4232 RepID=A0A9K3DS53_HELAN|nr:hypothetical protein HanXRQr2_Chr16g0744391 [Helianthus annuus]